jgi:hypothetical protein
MSTCTVTGRWTPPARDLYGHDQPFGLWDQTDDSLSRLRRQHLRVAADLARDGDLTQARREWWMAREIRDHQHMRFRLRMRYGAVDDHEGTTSYDCYQRHDEPPGYALALFMDSTRARLGRRHVLDWPERAVS